nr:hypothetical protein [Tanacetum cinerariifolium]
MSRGIPNMVQHTNRDVGRVNPGRRPTPRLTPDDFEARTDWWVSSRAYFDGHIHEPSRIPRPLNQNTQDDIPVDFYRHLEEQDRALKELMQKNAAHKEMYNKMNTFMQINC